MGPLVLGLLNKTGVFMSKRHHLSFDVPSSWGEQIQAVSVQLNRGLRAGGKAMDNTKTHATRVIGTTALAFGLTTATVGCSTTTPTRQQIGVVGGAVIGGAVGAAATKTKTGTVVGAGVGALIGKELTKGR
jgi:Glycine zipper